MKHKGLLFTTVFFFLLINTSYYWEGKLGIMAVPAFLLMGILFLILAAVLIAQIFFSFREKFKDKKRLLLIFVMSFTISVAIFKPNGLFDFEIFEGKDLLIAGREGVANCTKTLQLKENNEFVEKSICFGMTEVRGNYEVKKDTVFFSNVALSRDQKPYYKFAIMKQDSFHTNMLFLYMNKQDTLPLFLYIAKNDLKKSS